jgi:RNA polymerase sigma-70 factor, ECF subfamily
MAQREASDEQLMAGIAAGDAAALEFLVGRWSGSLLGFIRNRQGADPEDIFQETWLRVIRSAHRFDSRRRFSTWVFQIAVNLCRDAYRRSQTQPRANGIDVDAQVFPNREAAAPDRLVLKQLMSMLHPEDRELIHLRFLEGFREREIAEILGIPLGTVKSRTHHIIKKLRDHAGANDGSAE